MDNELLTDILAAEREISQRISTLELQAAERLEMLNKELEQMLAREAAQLDKELQLAGAAAEQAATVEADALLNSAREYAARLEDIPPLELGRVLLRHLVSLIPEECHDRQNEQT